MKRILCCLFCFSLLCSFIGCIQKKNSPDLFQGMYYALGEYEYGLRPYILLLPHKSEFDLGIGTAISTVRGGTYQIIDDNIISSTDSPIFRFEIKDKNTLVLTANDDDKYFKVPINTQFVFSEELK